jgi:GTP-binding protein
MLDAAHARHSKPRQRSIHATVGHHQKKRGITRTPLRYGKPVGRSTARRSVMRGQQNIMTINEVSSTIQMAEPTISMTFGSNNSPFFGKEGKFITSSQIKEYLDKAVEIDPTLKVEPTENVDTFLVYGLNVSHLSALIESMRNEGYELLVGHLQVITKEIDGVKCEPIEHLKIELPEEFANNAVDLVTLCMGQMVSMVTEEEQTIIEFKIPSRGVIGLRSELLSATAGFAIFFHSFLEYAPYAGKIEDRKNGSFICMEGGKSVAFALDKLKDRGRFFIEQGQEVYMGQVIGEHSRPGDLVINVTKEKQLTNMRSSGSDTNVGLPPVLEFSVESALEYFREDEYVEITPKSIRLRKIYLDEGERKRHSN